MTDIDTETVPRDEIVRLSANFIDDVQKREQVLAIFAFIELLRDVPARVSEPLLGDIRYTWWLEAIEEIAAGGKVRYHPLSAALEPLIREQGLDAEAFRTAIEAHRVLLDGKLSMRDALTVADHGAVLLIRQAARLLDAKADSETLAAPARFQALAALKAARLLRDEEAGEAEYRHLYREARAALKRVPTALLPLVLPSALAGDVWFGRTRGAFSVRARLLWAFVSGRI
ncbi:squalene/phytoene synthase family protein [Asticcacaulis sp. YBE204]|uniref:squalene/phytoene synthase family protein n=1 Tax=Asticcacaulis sp. YBE204 TaxID=1282363 RepID=UPI0003C4026D|nr:squalene/phytoene synthase family protein [Asticcacaulis sp. YBE204]ESQ80482.1 hypothetical protein AEYBE204_04235 [Asticcacaulis sp. YBE204]